MPLPVSCGSEPRAQRAFPWKVPGSAPGLLYSRSTPEEEEAECTLPEAKPLRRPTPCHMFVFEGTETLAILTGESVRKMMSHARQEFRLGGRVRRAGILSSASDSVPAGPGDTGFSAMRSD